MEGMSREMAILSPAISAITVTAVTIGAITVSITIAAVDAIAVHGINRIHRSHIITRARVDHDRGDADGHDGPGNHYHRRRSNRSEREHHQNRR
jgi:hypothetical protein